MKNRTGELREGFREISRSMVTASHYNELNDAEFERYMISYLKACKEKGLKFVTVSRPGVYPYIDEIEI